MSDTSASTAPPRPAAGAVVVTVTLLLGTQPVATDLYLPSLPSMPEVFGVPVATVQLTLSGIVMAFGVGQLLLGPVADRIGRRPVLLGGLMLYVLASVLAALSPHVAWLIAARVGQGLGMAACVVGARSLVRDLYEPQEGARVLARALMWMSVAPLVGPVLGGLIESTVGWRGAFAAQTVFGLATLAWIARRVPETIAARNPHALAFGHLARNGWDIVRHRTFLTCTAVSGCSYAGLFTYLAGSSFVLVDVLGLTRQQFGFSFSFVVCGYLLGTLVCRRLVRTRGIVHTHRVGAAISLAGGLSMALLAWAGVWHPLALLLPQFLFLMGHGLHQPCAQAGAIGPFPTRAGAAAALSGFLTMVVAFGAGNWIGAALDGTVRPLAYAVGFWSVLTALAATVLVERYGVPPAVGEVSP